MPNWEAYAEADRRGILPPEKKTLYDEAKRRGLIPGSTAEPEPKGETAVEGLIRGSKDALKYAAGGAGALLGGPAGGVLGYAMGGELVDIIEGKKAKTIPGSFKQAAENLKTGAEMELGGRVGSRAIEAAGQTIAKAAPRIYESVLKVPPRSIPNEVRTRAVGTALEGKYAPTQGGLEKLRSDIDSLNNQIAFYVDRASGTGRQVDMNAVVQRVEKLKDFYGVLPPERAKPFLEDLNKIQADYLSGGGRVSIADAQAMKQRIYQLHRKHYGELKAATIEGEKAIARGLKEELVKQVPEIGSLNAKDSARIELENVLERAVGRTRNWDLIGLVDVAGSAGGAIIGGSRGDLESAGKGAAIGALVTRAMRDPAVLSRLAFALHKARRIKGEGLARPAAYLAFGSGSEPRQGQ